MRPDRRRDARDLAVLALREHQTPVHEIARVLRIPRDVVESILAADRAAFPDELLGARR